MLLFTTGDYGNFGRFAMYAPDLVLMILITTHWQAQVAQNLAQRGASCCCHYVIFPLHILSFCDHDSTDLSQVVYADIVKGFGQVWSSVMLVAFFFIAVIIHLIIDLDAQTAWCQSVCTTGSGSGLNQGWPTWFVNIDQVMIWKTCRGLFLSLGSSGISYSWKAK